jgi:hypothetical protein
MPYYYVGKGSQFTVIDAEYAGDYMAAYKAALAVLEGPDEMSFGDMARRHTSDSNDPRSGLTSDDVTHFETDWLGRSWATWAEHPVEPLLRHGFIKAIKCAQKEGLPLEALWCCTDEDVFQIYICQGPRQVTVIVYTPRPVEHVADAKLTEPEKIWVVKVRDESDELMTGSPLEHVTDVDGKEIIYRQLMTTP